MHHPTDRITHTTAFVTSRGALAGTRNRSMGTHSTSELRPAPQACTHGVCQSNVGRFGHGCFGLGRFG